MSQLKAEIAVAKTPPVVVNVRQFLRLQAAILLMAAMSHLAILMQDQGEVVNMAKSSYGVVLFLLLVAAGLETLALGIDHGKDWARIITIASGPIVMAISFFWVLGGVVGLIWIAAYAVIVGQLFKEKDWFLVEEPIDFEKHLFHFVILGILVVLGFILGTYIVNNPDVLINSWSMSG
ncbi:hypothetical protein J7K05_02130 [bacterium]|nr:hypothetical protein [bacterium]